MKQSVKIAMMIAACMISGMAGANLTTQPQVVVSFADLDLNNESAQKILYRRLKQAASDVCGTTRYNIAGSVAAVEANKACFHKAMNNAVNAIDMPALSELHDRQRPLADEQN